MEQSVNCGDGQDLEHDLVDLVGRQARQISAMALQISNLVDANEALTAGWHGWSISRNSGNSSSLPSKDDQPGKTPPTSEAIRGTGRGRKPGKQPGARGRTGPGSTIRTSAVIAIPKVATTDHGVTAECLP